MSRPERILVLTTSYPRADEDPSGHFVRAEARELARAGANVHVIAPGASAACIDGVTVHGAGGDALFGWPGALSRAHRRPWRLAYVPAFAHRVRAHVRSIGPVDRAVAHWLVPCAWPLGLAIDGPREAVGHGADVRLLCALPSPLCARVVREILKSSTQVRFVAAALRDQLCRKLPRALGAQLERDSIIRPVSLDLPEEDLAPAVLRARLGIPEGRALAVAVGRLVASKRVHLAIRAAYESDADVHLVVVGDGPESESLKRLAASLTSPRGTCATFLGLRPRSETVAWMRAADALIHASASEGAPTVVREARALGTPVVACDAGDLVAWAETDPNIRITPPEPSAIARALEHVLTPAH